MYISIHMFLFLTSFLLVQVTTPSPVLTPEVILDINKRMIGTVKNSNFNEEYVCVLCLAQINSRRVSCSKHCVICVAQEK